MATFPEARARKAERDRRERRHFTPDLLGGRCPGCGQRVVAAARATFHPTCGPDAAYDMRRDLA